MRYLDAIQERKVRQPAPFSTRWSHYAAKLSLPRCGLSIFSGRAALRRVRMPSRRWTPKKAEKA